MSYTNINKPKEHYHGETYSGNGSTKNIDTLDFSPDCIWIRRTNSNAHWKFVDKITGTNKSSKINARDGASITSGVVNSFDSNGFTLSTSDGDTNSNGSNYLSFNFKGNGTSLTNNDGTITSIISPNTTSGFSLVTYTGNSTSGATVGHGLGYAPDMIIVKRIDGSSDWVCQHKGISQNNVLKLNTTGGSSGSSAFNNTRADSSVVTLGNDGDSNNNGSDHVMMCFSNISGYCKIDNYTGNGDTNGPFIYTGFKPKLVIMKSSSSGEWYIVEEAAGTGNTQTKHLHFEFAGGYTTVSNGVVDLLSNGFKIRTSDVEINQNNLGITYIAIADYSIVGTNNVPGTGS